MAWLHLNVVKLISDYGKKELSYDFVELFLYMLLFHLMLKYQSPNLFFVATVPAQTWRCNGIMVEHRHYDGNNHTNTPHN